MEGTETRPLIPEETKPPGPPPTFLGKGTEFWVMAGVLTVKIVLVFLITAAAIFSLTHRELVGRLTTHTLLWIKSSRGWAAVLYVSIYSIAAAVFFPAEIMTIAAGFLFADEATYGFYVGIPLGVFLSLISQLISVSICFWLARLFFFEPTERVFRNGRYYSAFQAAVKEGGAKFVGLLRLSPIVPFTISNYLLGITAIEYQSVLLGGFGALPNLAIQVWIGSAVSDVKDIVADGSGWHFDTRYIIVTVVGIILTSAAMGYIYVLTRRKLDAWMYESPQQLTDTPETTDGVV